MSSKISKDPVLKHKNKFIVKIMPKRSSRNINQNSSSFLDNSTEPNKVSNQQSRTFCHIVKIEYVKNGNTQSSSNTINDQPPSINSKPKLISKLQKNISRSNKISFNHPINSLIPLKDINSKKDICALSSRINCTNVANMNNTCRSIRCPFCKNDFSQEENLNLTKDIVGYNGKNKNMNINLDNGILDKEKKPKIKKVKMRNFYFNENGGIVFKPNIIPTISIRIVKKKSNLSKYIKESKVYGKKKNINIYEGPAPETKVFIRPIVI